MRTITLEEHYATSQFLDGPGRQLKQRMSRPGSPTAIVLERLCDVGEKRIADMDAAGIDVQVLSLTSPGVEQLEPAEALAFSRSTNEFLAMAVRKYPDRLAGFATLPTSAPAAAAVELQRVVRDYGFKGAVINGHARGRYLDDRFFWPIFERAEELNVPIYLHPTQPPQPVIDASYGGFSPMVTETLAGAGWGWHIETAVHVIRLILGGVFDRFPKLQLVIGHMGEGLPFMLPRFQVLSTDITKLRLPVAAYLRENIHYTFSGFNFTATFLDLLLEVGVDRIMFSADYPYASMERARSFLEQLPVSATDRERIAHTNAERLFGL
ncbi:MAG TPA: amidohydrolase family protein [Candidatus Dormibacteraeota bacterium]|nr:amidohydrolase family protein [Candidatus Dormibacteraeota bacterium]